jgi:glycosyltransferase involved in cell wall biosynthesis
VRHRHAQPLILPPAREGRTVHLVALVDAPDHVCCRYRIAAFGPALAAAGHSVEAVGIPKWWWSRLLLYHRLRGANVLLQRRLLPCWEFALLRAAAGRLLFDLDDAIWLRDSYSPKGTHHPRKSRRFAYTVVNCDAVVAGNRHLAEQAMASGARGAVVIPTCVEPASYPPASGGDGRTLVWVGSSSTLQGLERVGDLLDALALAVPGVRLKVVCDRFPKFRHMPTIDVPWDAASEPAEIASSDVGISWIPDDPWSRGKCGLKVLQYMAAGLPVITNPVGVHPEMVTPATGILASTPEEWQAAVARLLSDAGLRRDRGRAGRARVEAEYSVAAGARRWVELLETLEGRAARAG